MTRARFIRSLVTLLAVSLTACVGSDGSAASTGSRGDTTQATPISTTTTATSVPVPTTPATTDTGDATCSALEAAHIELEDALSSVLDEDGDLDSMGDTEAAEAFLTPVIEFYEQLGVIADTAPTDVAGDLVELAESAAPMRSIIDLGDLAELDRDDAEPPFDIATESVVRVDAWAAENCGTSASFDPGELITTTLFSAMFGALGEDLGDLGELGEEFGVDGDQSPQAYGDDPELDALWDSCGGGDLVACDDLYWRTFGVYELFAQTCGGQVTYQGGGGGYCEDRLADDAPMTYGADPHYDGLWDSCDAGDPYSCDTLAATGPVGSEYADFGATCGGTVDDTSPKSCSDPAQPFSYGDAPDLDALWDGCTGGDAEACSDLYFESAFSSVYETLGDTCGILTGRGESCDLILELLSTPAG